MSSQTSPPSTPLTPHTPDIAEDFEKLKVSSHQEPGTTSSRNGDDVLEQFRAQWREELKAKKGGGSSSRVNAGDAAWKEKKPAEEEGKPVELPPLSPSKNGKNGKAAAIVTSPKSSRNGHIALPDFGDHNEASSAGPSIASHPDTVIKATADDLKLPRPAKRPVPDKERAIQIYAKAVESEQSGKLNEALILYRRAFKMNDDVDKLYTRSVATAIADKLLEQKATSDNPMPSIPNSADIVSSSAPVEEPYSFQRHIQLHPDYVKSAAPQLTAAKKSAKSVLTLLFESLPIAPYESAFLPEDEELPIPIANLPSELIDPILAHLDVISIEHFASTCWRARFLTSSSSVWRRITERIYKEPAMLPLGGLTARDLVPRHGGEWRTTLIEEERVRMDGCYIAVCHYIRPGAGEEWITITHLITYHRYLRFYPDGSAISYLTTDHPSEIVPLLRPTLRGKGLHFGRWRLIRSDAPDDPDNEPAWTPSKAGEKRPARILVTDLVEPGAKEPKYEFEMELSLRQSGRGRWNKLDILEYRSINLSTGETLALSLKNQKPFFFSKVRSYNPPL